MKRKGKLGFKGPQDKPRDKKKEIQRYGKPGNDVTNN